MTDLNLDSIKTVENTGAGHLYVLRNPVEELGALGYEDALAQETGNFAWTSTGLHPCRSFEERLDGF